MRRGFFTLTNGKEVQLLGKSKSIGDAILGYILVSSWFRQQLKSRHMQAVASLEADCEHRSYIKSLSNLDSRLQVMIIVRYNTNVVQI